MPKPLAGNVSDDAESQVKKKKIWNVCEYVWIIPDFDNQMNKQVGYVKYSPYFQAAAEQTCSEEWYLELYPSGKNEKNSIALYLCLVKASEFPVLAEFKLSIHNSDGKVIDSKWVEYSFTKSQGWGYPEFMKRDSLTKNLKGDIVHIRVLVCYSVNERQSFQKIYAEPKLADFWNSVLENSKLTDVVLVAEGEEIKAHKIILSSRSAVFMAMFSHDLVENESGKVEIVDFSANSVRALIRFIYTNNIKIQGLDEAMSLVRAAEKYDVGDLKLLCLDYLKRNITLSNVEDMLLFADTYNASELKQCAMECILNNSQKFVRLDQFKKLAQNPNLFSELFLKTLEKLAIK